MKKTTTYFAVTSIVVLLFLGIFVYISATTYSVNDDPAISINNMTMYINDEKTITATVNGIDDGDYVMVWEVISEDGTTNIISFDSSITNIDHGDGTYTNTIFSGSVAGSASIRVGIRVPDENNIAIVTDEAQITVVDNSVSFKISSSVGETDNATITTSTSGMQLSVPTGYSSYEITWSSSDTGVATVDANGYVTPRGAGSTVIMASGIDNNGNPFVDYMTMVVDDDTQQQAANEGNKVNYTLASLAVNGTSVPNFSSGDYQYNVEVPSDTFTINAVTTTANLGIIIKHNSEIYTVTQLISWSPDSNNEMVFDICVYDPNTVTIGDNSVCGDENVIYNLIITKQDNNDGSNTGDDNALLEDTYLQSLSIDGELFDFSCVNSNVEGDQFVCNLEYTAPVGTTNIKVEAEAIDGYEFLESLGPREVTVETGDTSVILEIAKVGETDPVAFYNIVVTVPEDSNPPISTSIKDDEPNENNSGTGEMSSFIIFMVMLVSLVASLVVYTKKVGNN